MGVEAAMKRGRGVSFSISLGILAIAFSIVAQVRADPLDPRIVVRGSTTGGTYHIEDLHPFSLTLDAETVAKYGGIFRTGCDPDSPLDNVFGILFQNLTNQSITTLVIQFAINDFFDTAHPDPYSGTVEDLVFEGEGQRGFTFLGNPNARVDEANGTVTWVFTGNVPPGELEECEGLFLVKFYYFPQGTTARFSFSVPEPGTLGLLGMGLVLLMLLGRRFRA